MILINCSHPLTDAQRAQIEALTGQSIAREIHAPAHFDHGAPFAEQTAALVASIGLTSEEWQTAPILLVPPALNVIALVLLAELHGRMGYFAPVVRLRPVESALPPRYEVAEVLNLQEVRDRARAKR